MPYNFDEIVPRHNTDSVKYNLPKNLPPDLIPLWVADMDFKAPPEVLEKLREIVDHGIFGYTSPQGDGYFQAVSQWFEKYFAFKPKPSWLVPVPGVVLALGVAIRALTRPGDGVLIQQPVYHPFASVIEGNQRLLVVNPLTLAQGKYSLDFDDFEEKIRAHKVKLFILCNPHNPVGRVWSSEELTQMGEICLKHQCLIVSDEIHCDFTRSGHKHKVLATISPELAQSSIICTAPSKTFNLAGLQVSNIFIPNDALRDKFVQELRQMGCENLTSMGLAAGQAAYERGGDWLEELKIYLEGNLNCLKDFLSQHPNLQLVEPEGTYLLWLDCSALKLSPAELEELFFKKARLWLDSGVKFGQGGEQFYRLNPTCPRSVLQVALGRLGEALKTI